MDLYWLDHISESRGSIFVGMSSLAVGYKTLALQLIEALKARAAQKIVGVVSVVVPRRNHQYLYDHGGVAVFGPATNLVEGKRRNY